MKVFCIGFHKTGTTSIGEALELLGFRVTGPNGSRDRDIANTVHLLAESLVVEYDAFQDNPWPILYREMDEKCPGSKFILTLRDPESWIRSQVKQFGTKETPMRRWIYGVGGPKGNEEIFLERFNRHNREVREYFADRPEDLLVMDLAAGDGWEKLCPFLGKDVPRIPFPHANKATDREASKQKGAARLVKNVKRIVRDITDSGPGSR